MDLQALFQISHGVYVTGAVDGSGRLIGSCIDAVMVIEPDPAQIMISLNKQSYTCENVRKQRELSLSVLSEQVSDNIIRNFGMQTSRTADKWAVVPYHLMGRLPVLDEAVSVMTLQVLSVQETATHFVFLCQVNELYRQSQEKPLTYAEYQNRKKKGEQKMSETQHWVCQVCGYVYDGDIPFEELPDDWVCPLCGVPKSEFALQ